jgi:hypothetical protein
LIEWTSDLHSADSPPGDQADTEIALTPAAIHSVKVSLRTAVVAVSLLAGVHSVQAQSTSTHTWAGIGLGVAIPVGDRQVSDQTSGMNLSVTHQPGAHVFSLRTAGASEHHGDEYFDVGLLYGRGLVRGPLHATAAAGLGVVFGNRYVPGGGPDRETVGPGFGVPLEAQAFVRVFQYVGVGVYTFANFNAVKPLFGANLALKIGDLQ